MESYQTMANSEYREVQRGRQSPGANVRWQEGNTPDRSYRDWETKWEGPDSQDVGLEAAII